MKKILNQLIVVLGLGLMLSACHQEEIVTTSKGVIFTANAITSENLSGTIKGTLLAGKTYYFSSDLTVNDGDTLLLQEGVHLIAIGDGLTPATSPEIFMHGTFISLGTQDKPNYITVKNADDLHTQVANGDYSKALIGYWGGITCSPASSTKFGGDVIIKWTHIEFAGAASGPADDLGIYTPQGTPRFMMYFGNRTKNLIIEDSWFFGSKDDNIQVGGGHINIMRNTFEFCGAIGGEFFNIKTGTLGDIAYNLFVGSCTNAMKISDSGNSGVQCTATVYNNTMIDGGYRQTKTGRGGSIDIEKGARGRVFNNLIVNCRFGLRVTTDADYVNTTYGNNYFYGSTATIVGQFYSADDIAAVLNNKAASDIRSATPKDNDPLFYAFDVNKYDFAANPGPMAVTVQTANSITVGTSSFKLQPGSPAIGKGKIDFTPQNTVSGTGIYTPTITLPGKDIGAFQSDGTGNLH